MSKTLELTKLSSSSSLKWAEVSSRQKTVFRDIHEQDIWDKVSISCETGHYGKSSLSIFRKLLAIDKIFMLGENWTLGYNSMNFWVFLILPNLLRS